MTRREAVLAAAARLAPVSETPRLDAELLVAHVEGVAREALFLEPDAPLCGDPEPLVARRAGGEPVAYLLGRRGFRTVELEVDARVLVPRPETELLVEVALELPAGARVVDVGTGSGAVALALKAERPDLAVVGTDVSAGALEVARANARRLGLDVRFVEGDLLAGEEADAVLSNPPYVAEGDPLGPGVREHEPHVALFAGDDGLAVIRRLIPAAARAAWLAVEVGAGQAATVAGLMAGRRTEVLRDLAGHERVVVGRC